MTLGYQVKELEDILLIMTIPSTAKYPNMDLIITEILAKIEKLV